MRTIHRLVVLFFLLLPSMTYAMGFVLEGLAWRIAQSNNWALVNSETVPNQTISYRTVPFNYAPGFRIGVNYISDWDALLSFTRFYTSANDSVNGNIQPAFSGSVSAEHVFSSGRGQIHQSVDYNIFDLLFGKRFCLTSSCTVHPIFGFTGGWINNAIHAAYQSDISVNEKIANNFSGIGPKAGVDTDIVLLNYPNFQPKLMVSFAASYLLGHWNIHDFTIASTSKNYAIDGTSHSMGALALQGALGVKLDYKNVSVKLSYEINDWFDQYQFFDNDTGAHNNDLVLQGVTLGFSVHFEDYCSE